MANYSHPLPDNSLADQSSEDPLGLNSYVASNMRHQHMENAHPASQSPSMPPNPALVPTYSDMAFANGSRDYQSYGTSYDRAQIPSPATKSHSFTQHRTPVSNFSEGPGSVASGIQHRLSTSTIGDFSQQRDGLDQNTSPESGLGLSVMGVGETMNDSMGTRADGSVSGDGGEGSIKDKDGNLEPPPWSEMKTKAGKERKRLPLACIACRRKKIRCSGEKPACRHCLRSRIPCVYKVTTRKAAPRTDYMAMLDKRLKRMEDRVIKLIPKENAGSVPPMGRSVVKPPLPGTVPKPSATKKRAADEAFGNDLEDWSKSGASKQVEENATATSKARTTEEGKLLTEGVESLPSKEMQEHLAEVYFDFVYGQSYPLLHKPSFMRRLAAGNVPPVLTLAICAISARFSTHPQLRTEPAFLRGEEWATKAREIALKRYDAPNITILIVYLLLGLHEFGTCQGGRSWMFGGMAQRMAYALQLHRDLDYDPLGGENGERKKLSFIDREIRRRTMWSCFLMDRFNSSGTERPLFVNEQFIQVQLPVKEQLYIDEIAGSTEDLDGGASTSNSEQLTDTTANMGVMAYLIRLVSIWGELIKYLNLGGLERETVPTWDPESTFNCIKGRLQKFKETLPETLHHNEENLKSHAIEGSANQLLYLHILYYQSVLFLNRFARPSTASGDSIPKLRRTSRLADSGAHTPNEVPQEFLAEAARNALEAAEQVSIVISASMDHNVVAPFVGYSAFFSSTIHIRGVFSKNPQLEEQSKKYLASNVKYLTKMKKYWGMFHYIAENLKDLYRQHADAALRGPAAGNSKGQEQIFQYGDWFDRYPHGVSNTDYEDPATKVKREPGTDAVLGQKSDLQSVEEFFASLSPPSRAEHQRKMAKKKKQAKPKTDDLPSIDATAQLQPQLSPSQHTPLQHPPQDLHQMRLQPDVVENFDPAYYASNPANASFPTPFAQIPGQPQPPQSHAQNIGLMNHATATNSLLPLDLSAFAGSAAPDLWNLDLGGMPNTGGMGNGFFPDQSMAWFMPFNMEPPTLGDDGVFAGDAWGFGGPHVGTGDVMDEGGGMGS